MRIGAEQNDLTSLGGTLALALARPTLAAARDKTHRARHRTPLLRSTLGGMQSQGGEIVDADQILNGVQEVGKVLAHAGSAGVCEWGSEHVHRGFGWAEWLEMVLADVDARDTEDLSADVARLQDSSSDMLARSVMPLTFELLRGSRSVLLSTLLRNPLTRTSILVEALRLADRSPLADSQIAAAAASVLLPAARIDAELRLLAMLDQTTRIESERVCGGSDLSPATETATRRPASSSQVVGLGELLWQSLPHDDSPSRGGAVLPRAAEDGRSAHADERRQRWSRLIEPPHVHGTPVQRVDPSALQVAASLLLRSCEPRPAHRRTDPSCWFALQPFQVALTTLRAAAVAAVADSGSGAELWTLSADALAAACHVEVCTTAMVPDAEAESCPPLLAAYARHLEHQLHLRFESEAVGTAPEAGPPPTHGALGRTSMPMESEDVGTALAKRPRHSSSEDRAHDGAPPCHEPQLSWQDWWGRWEALLKHGPPLEPLCASAFRTVCKGLAPQQRKRLKYLAQCRSSSSATAAQLVLRLRVGL
jgi:hypothetical protein